MTGHSLFDVDVVRAALLPVDWADPAPPAGVLREYIRHYGLDFGGRIAGLRHGLGYLDVKTPLPSHYRIAVQLFQVPAPRGTVLLIHGYFDHVGIYDHVIEHLLARDFDVVAFDLPGHGLSTGDQAAIDDFAEYQHVLDAILDGMAQTRLVVPLSVVAQSTGGAIIMEWLLRARSDATSSPFAAVVALSPLVRPAHWPLNRVLYYLMRPFRRQVARKFAVNSHDKEFLAFLRGGDPLQSRWLPTRWVGAMKRWIPRLENATPCEYPLVVVQGDEDGTVDWRYNLGVIRAKFPCGSVHMIPTGRHQLVNESPGLRARVFAALDRALPRSDAN